MLDIIRSVIFTELSFMAQHPAAIAVAAVVLGLVALQGYRVSAR